jgi:hypothetical protein
VATAKHSKIGSREEKIDGRIPEEEENKTLASAKRERGENSIVGNKQSKACASADNRMMRARAEKFDPLLQRN